MYYNEQNEINQMKQDTKRRANEIATAIRGIRKTCVVRATKYGLFASYNGCIMEYEAKQELLFRKYKKNAIR